MKPPKPDQGDLFGAGPLSAPPAPDPVIEQAMALFHVRGYLGVTAPELDASLGGWHGDTWAWLIREGRIRETTRERPAMGCGGLFRVYVLHGIRD